ncbi:hypothetical protein MKW94_029441, partial [Papaver nudicaule]|nr:hypothetical protein [Papaver nudicaule]
VFEGKRDYECRKCKHRFPVIPELETGNSIRLPSYFQFVENSIVCHDYQEIKIQESTQVLGVGSIPLSIPVVLKDDLVDIVKAGDDVIVMGVLTAKWSSDLKDVRCDLDPLFVANHIAAQLNNIMSPLYLSIVSYVALDVRLYSTNIDVPEKIIQKFEQFWVDFKDTPLKGINRL